MWKGKWQPSVYHFPSVWNGLATLEETLLRLRASTDKSSVRGTTVFYFTDNLGVSWISTNGSSKSPNLHKLITRIRRLELELDCYLQVVHVPGLVLIEQGTDGLSQECGCKGVRVLPLRTSLLRLSLTLFPSTVTLLLSSTSHRSTKWTVPGPTITGISHGRQVTAWANLPYGFPLQNSPVKSYHLC
jgi:hypothetical protein